MFAFRSDPHSLSLVSFFLIAFDNKIISVSNQYSLNPDPAKNLNLDPYPERSKKRIRIRIQKGRESGPDQDPSYFFTLSEKT